MNKLRTIVMATGAAGLIMTSLVANAIPVTITDVVNPSPDIVFNLGLPPTPCGGFTCSVNTLSFVHDITDNGFSLSDDVLSGTVTIRLTDNQGSEMGTYTVALGTRPPLGRDDQLGFRRA